MTKKVFTIIFLILLLLVQIGCSNNSVEKPSNQVTNISTDPLVKYLGEGYMEIDKIDFVIKQLDILNTHSNIAASTLADDYSPIALTYNLRNSILKGIAESSNSSFDVIEKLAVTKVIIQNETNRFFESLNELDEPIRKSTYLSNNIAIQKKLADTIINLVDTLIEIQYSKENFLNSEDWRSILRLHASLDTATIINDPEIQASLQNNKDFVKTQQLNKEADKLTTDIDDLVNQFTNNEEQLLNEMESTLNDFNLGFLLHVPGDSYIAIIDDLKKSNKLDIVYLKSKYSKGVTNTTSVKPVDTHDSQNLVSNDGLDFLSNKIPYEFNMNLKFDPQLIYKFSDINNSVTISDKEGYEFEGEFSSYKDEISDFLSSFNYHWIEYVNTGNELVFNFVEEGSRAYENVKNYNRTNEKEKYLLMEIGEIRENNEYIYVWTHEIIEKQKGNELVDKDYHWIYKILRSEMDYYIVDYALDPEFN